MWAQGAEGGTGRVNFSVQRREVDGVPVVSAVGELDGGSVELLAGELELALDALPPAIIVDLAGVTFIDSTGVRAVTRKQDSLVSLETRLYVVAPADRIREVFVLTGTADGVPLHRSLDEALVAAAQVPIMQATAVVRVPAHGLAGPADAVAVPPNRQSGA
ncbi:STAS domain-containing protein [Georgenia yuyongxinii]|uniref:Anti-sigma factor antagonist n=1 Tax=Georgenia yuyongxinii TaxID=2589797 RepID=A0A5B8C246_9MICO|nr:STAS domain-containing protein [Georgenia yuyongxinii]